jgi:hypothetical protein
MGYQASERQRTQDAELKRLRDAQMELLQGKTAALRAANAPAPYPSLPGAAGQQSSAPVTPPDQFMNAATAQAAWNRGATGANPSLMASAPATAGMQGPAVTPQRSYATAAAAGNLAAAGGAMRPPSAQTQPSLSPAAQQYYKQWQMQYPKSRFGYPSLPGKLSGAQQQAAVAQLRKGLDTLALRAPKTPKAPTLHTFPMPDNKQQTRQWTPEAGWQPVPGTTQPRWKPSETGGKKPTRELSLPKGMVQDQRLVKGKWENVGEKYPRFKPGAEEKDDWTYLGHVRDEKGKHVGTGWANKKNKKMVVTTGDGKEIPWEKGFRTRSKAITDRGYLTGQEFKKHLGEMSTEAGQLRAMERYMGSVKNSRVGWRKVADQVVGKFKTIFARPKGKEELEAAVAKGELQGMIGALRVQTLGGGVVTEFDAQRLLLRAGGDVGLFQDPVVVARLLRELYAEKANYYNEDLLPIYNMQLTLPAYSRMKERKAFKMDTSIFESGESSREEAAKAQKLTILPGGTDG